MISPAETWDARYWVILGDLRGQGVVEDNARAIAELECTEQFGVRPEEQG